MSSTSNPLSNISSAVKSLLQAGPYRPPQWSRAPMVMVTVPAAGTAGTVHNNIYELGQTVNGVLTFSSTSTMSYPMSYVFDAVLAAEHDQSLTKTRHPVQTGAAVSSHAYIEPAVLVLYVLMSDVTPQYAAVAQKQSPYVQPWTGNTSKSVSAYQTMINLQAQRLPLTVVTRLRTYSNMLIDRIAPREDEKTITGARFRIEFGQVILASTQAAAVSARPNDTNSTGLGAVNPVAPSATTQQQFGVPLDPGVSGPTGQLNFNVPGVSGDTGTLVNVPGASNYSSSPQQFGLGNNVGSLFNTGAL